jgi:hypothetical protein
MTAPDLQARAREIAAGLDRDTATSIEILGCCPNLPAWSPSLSRLGVLADDGVLNDLGRAIAAVLAEGGAR